MKQNNKISNLKFGSRDQSVMAQSASIQASEIFSEAPLLNGENIIQVST